MNLQFSFDILLLVCALSLDTFLVSISYGISKIKIPIASTIIMNLVCSSILAFSLFFGTIIRSYVDSKMTEILSFSILFILGCVKLFDYLIKYWIKKHQNQDLHFHFFDFQFIIQVYADSTKADSDDSKVLSGYEACLLAITLSLDGAGAGIGAGLMNFSYLSVILFSFVLGVVVVILGSWIGHVLSRNLKYDFSWLSGVMLLLLAFLRK